MAKNSRAVHTRLATTIHARYYPEDQLKDAYFLDGRFTSKRELRSADTTMDRQERGSLFAVFAYHGEHEQRVQETAFAQSFLRLSDACSRGPEAIDAQINDLADLAVEVSGKATLSTEGRRGSYFAGVLVKEGEMAAVTNGGGCAFLYRGDVLYPLTECDYPLQPVDLNGNPVDRLNDYSAGIAGTIRYSNIASVQENDCIILCNKELMEALGQQEVLQILFNAETQEDAAADMIAAAEQKVPGQPIQVMMSLVNSVSQPEKSGRLSLFTGPQKTAAQTYVPPVSMPYAEAPGRQSAPMPESETAPQPMSGPAPQDEQAPYAPNDSFRDPYAPEAQTESMNDPFYQDYPQDAQVSAYDEGRRYASQGYGYDQGQVNDPYAPNAYGQQQYDHQGYGREQSYGDAYSSNQYDPYDQGYDQAYQQGYDQPYDQGYDQGYGSAYGQHEDQGRYQQSYDGAYDQNYGGAYGDEEPVGRSDQDPYQRANRGGSRDGRGRQGGRRDAYYDDFDPYEDPRGKRMRMIIYGVIGLIFLICVFLLLRMMLKQPAQTNESTVASTQNIFVNSSQSQQPSMPSQPAGNSTLPSVVNSNATQMSNLPDSSQSTLPVSTPQGSGSQPAVSGTQAGPAGSQQYKVVAGDTVSAIAKKFYGSDAEKYVNKIRDANPDKVDQQYNIYVDDVLVIPPKD